MKKHLATWLGVAVSVAVIAFIASKFNLGAAADAIGGAQHGWLALAAVLYLALFPLRGLRWTRLLRGVKPISVGSATEVFIVGAMANNVLPARLGDVARAFVLGRREQIRATTTFSNVMLERIIDGITVVGFLAGVLIIAPPGAAWVRSVGLSMTALFVVALAGCFMLAHFETWTLNLTKTLLSPLPEKLTAKILDRVALLVEGLAVLKQPRAMVEVIGLSLLIWTLEVAVYALVQQAFGMTLSTSALVLVMAVLTLGLTAPSAPGFVGVFEGLIVTAVSLYGVERDLALAFAITVHLIHYVPVTLLGLAYAWRSGLKIRELKYAAGEPAPGGI